MRSPRGPLTQRGHRFLCQRKRWERKRRGGIPPSALPPMRNQAKFPLRRDCASSVPFEPSFLPMRKVLYCHARQITAKTESYRQKIGRPPKKAALLEGSGEGNEKFPSPPFLFPVSFREKKSGSRRVGGLCGEHKTPTLGVWSVRTEFSPCYSSWKTPVER